MIKYFSILFLCFSNCFSMQRSSHHWFTLHFELPNARKDTFLRLLTEKRTWKIDGDDIVIKDRNSLRTQHISDSTTLFELRQHFFNDASFDKTVSKSLITICGNMKNILSQDYFPGRDVCTCIGGARSELIHGTRTNDHTLEELLANIRSKKLELGASFKDAYGDGYIVRIKPDSTHKPTSFSLDFFTYFIAPWKAERTD